MELVRLVPEAEVEGVKPESITQILFATGPHKPISFCTAQTPLPGERRSFGRGKDFAVPFPEGFLIHSLGLLTFCSLRSR
jgi:hypothetical protein